MMQTTPIELQRVLLRPPRGEDAEMVYRNWATDAEVAKFVTWRPHSSIEDTRAYLAFAGDGWDKGTDFTWLICLKSDGEPIGAISLRKEQFKAAIGYVLSRRHWGRGLILEAAGEPQSAPDRCRGDREEGEGAGTLSRRRRRGRAAAACGGPNPQQREAYAR